MVIGYGLALLAGVGTFFATCLLPVLPVYIAYLGGLSISSEHGSSESSRRTVLTHSIVFVLGFLMVFSMLGFAATAIGRLFAQYRSLLQKVGGLLIIFFGIGLMDVVKIPFFAKTYHYFIPSSKRRGSFIGAFLFGITFGFAWVPCIGPVLATILLLMSLGTNPAHAAALLAVFALGLGIPFLVLGAFVHTMGPVLTHLQKRTHFIQPLLGLCIVLVGLLLVTDTLSILSQWSLHWGGALLL